MIQTDISQIVGDYFSRELKEEFSGLSLSVDGALYNTENQELQVDFYDENGPFEGTYTMLRYVLDFRFNRRYGPYLEEDDRDLYVYFFEHFEDDVKTIEKTFDRMGFEEYKN